MRRRVLGWSNTVRRECLQLSLRYGCAAMCSSVCACSCGAFRANTAATEVDSDERCGSDSSRG